MASLTATADDTNAHVELFFVSPPVLVQNQFTIVRVHPDGTEYVVRGAYRRVADYFVFDSEAPLDTAVTYRAFEDVVGLDPSANVVTGGPVTVNSNGFNWFKDPARPWANVRVDLCPQSAPCSGVGDSVSLIRLGDKTRASDANLIPVLDRETPADIWARRKGIVSSVTFLTRTLAAIDDIYTLFTAGGPLLLQFQPLYGWPDAYWQPGELSEVYTGSNDQRLPYRRWSVPLVQVDRPSPASAAQGTACANWCAVEDTYATVQDLTDTGYTWLQVADCTAVPGLTDGYGFGPYGSGPYGDGG